MANNTPDIVTLSSEEIWDHVVSKSLPHDKIGDVNTGKADLKATVC